MCYISIPIGEEVGGDDSILALRFSTLPPLGVALGDIIFRFEFLFSAERFLLSIKRSTISLLCICIEFWVLPPQPEVFGFPLLDANEVLPLLSPELVWNLIDGCEFNTSA